MSKTVELRKVIVSLLEQVTPNVSFDKADKKTQFPYSVYSMNNVDLSSYPRDDISVTVDIWDKDIDSIRIETLTDKLEKILNRNNHPTDKILPTFYLVGRNSLEDEDPLIQRRQLKFIVKNYEVRE
ncbi:hypothetical protein [Clostridium sp.]|uniref:hypothetical protein n=1 Tax=Clostridium sp. TaxID=1506 RepID=UPI00290FC863|nr:MULTISPECIES: hypothetical protein [Clostridium]MDU4725927.1 hypothetical protein [Clostridium sp.]MDY4721513.1 hypothetical protein [Clostridium paraputrificum]